MLQNRQVFLSEKERYSNPCKRAAGNKDDFIPERQGALRTPGGTMEIIQVNGEELMVLNC
jgi:hypothetical protein